ncbi:MAG TPA: hypothetical protein VMS17_18720 [Gemmataceae bacterium]|nr:hypothetical protein [Gemmataceae bacterium]
MSATSAPPPASERAAGVLSLGFLTVLREANGYLGGYLVVNGWGRPLEFRMTSAVQPNRVQQILYGGTLESYICADLIGKTLVDKAGAAAQLVITDRLEVLDLRMKLDTPVAWLAPGDGACGVVAKAPSGGRGAVQCHPRFEIDLEPVRAVLDRLDSSFDLGEPFLRIREAIGEARKMGVAAR